MTQPVVSVHNLIKRFNDVTAVDGVSFAIERGETVGLLGGNGAGKTSTLAMLLGLLSPDGGGVKIFDRPMPKDRHAVLPRMNFSSPYLELPHRLTVYENLAVYGRLYGLSALDKRIRDIAQDLEISPVLQRRSGKLSSGQKTRVALAKSMLNRPELLLLDEPTASLDPDTGDWVRGYLEQYRKQTGATIILASHNMGEVERLCHRVLMMRRGEIVASGAPLELLARYRRENLEDVFLDIARERREALP